jgi:hypothetical protein
MILGGPVRSHSPHGPMDAPGAALVDKARCGSGCKARCGSGVCSLARARPRAKGRDGVWEAWAAGWQRHAAGKSASNTRPRLQLTVEASEGGGGVLWQKLVRGQLSHFPHLLSLQN